MLLQSFSVSWISRCILTCLYDHRFLLLLGYCVSYPFMIMLRQDFSSTGIQSYVHHISAGAGILFGLSVVRPSIFVNMILANLLTEASTPFMHFRQFFIWHGMGKSQLAFINNLAFFVSFLILRIILQSYVIYTIIIFGINSYK